jgi:predicted ATPase/class 3 adenylate cyclase
VSASQITATFLFTDLEDSTPLWENQPELMPSLSARHDALLRQAIEGHGGAVVKTTGDGFHAVFDSAMNGVAAAIAGQRAILEESWPEASGPLRVRMGLHSGESRFREGDYYGSDVNRAARVMGVAHGGQIILSEATAVLVRHGLAGGVTLSDLGHHRLRGLAGEERIYQICHPRLPSAFPPLKSLTVYKHNLKAQLSSFIGREKEFDQAIRLLGETRLLTLLGPGGTGKSRLMLEVTEELVGEFEDGVWLVELAPLSDPERLPEQVAAAIHVEQQPGGDLVDAIVAFLKRKEVLLLLDNVEHLVRESAALAEHLLGRCPNLKLFVTGREALFISGERTMQLPSLSLPPVEGDGNLEEIRASEGVQLFLSRAQEIDPQFELSQSNGATVAEVVRRLDGIPFAIELAAARLRVFSVAQIAERLNDRFRLLTGGRRNALPRQQTLEAMIDWSWGLLDDVEKQLLQRLSVFAGGWTIKAAVAVAGDERLDEYVVIDLLQNLANKSLIVVSTTARGDERYSMLESIHAFGRDRLFESGMAEQLRDRHAAFFAAFALEAGQHRALSTLATWETRIRLELDNLRAAISWSLDKQPGLALRIVGNLLYREAHWLTLGEAGSWLESAVNKTRPLLEQGAAEIRVEEFIMALIGLGFNRITQGHPELSTPFAEESIQLARESGHTKHLGYATTLKLIPRIFRLSEEELEELEEAIALGREHELETELVLTSRIYAGALFLKGKAEQAVQVLDEALDRMGQVEDPRKHLGVLNLQVFRAEFAGDAAAAKKYRKLAVAQLRAAKHRRTAAMHESELAHLLRREGSLEEAEVVYRRTVVEWQAMGQLPAVTHQVECFAECFAYLAIAGEAYGRAATLLGAAEASRAQLEAVSRMPIELEELTSAMEQLEERLGKVQLEAKLAKGRSLSLDEAVTLALSDPAQPADEQDEEA